MRAAYYEKNVKEYEKHRAVNMKKNNEVLVSLNLPTLAAGMRCANPKKKGKEKAQEGSEDYVAEPGEEHSGNDALEIPPKMRCS